MKKSILLILLFILNLISSYAFPTGGLVILDKCGNGECELGESNLCPEDCVPSEESLENATECLDVDKDCQQN